MASAQKKLKNPVSRLTRVFVKAQDYAGKKAPRMLSVGLRIGCPVIEEERRKIEGLEGKRAFAHAGHFPNVICTAWETVDLPTENQLGLIFHEFGHLLASDDEEESADMAAYHLLSVRVEYGDLRLQYLHPDDVEKVMS